MGRDPRRRCGAWRVYSLIQDAPGLSPARRARRCDRSGVAGLPFSMLAGKNRQLLRDYEVNYVPIIVFIGRDGRIHRIFHHYILAKDFETSVKEIVE